MAIMKNNNIRGKIGDLVFRQCGGKTVISAAPRRKSTYAKTPKEMAVQLLFKKRSLYASKAMRDEVLRNLYASKISGRQTAYKLALRDAVNAPEISFIDAGNYSGKPGSEIIVQAFDDFMVKEVRVDIVDGKGEFLESGFAIPDEDELHWKYTARNMNMHVNGTNIIVHAFDHPHNSGSLEVML